VARVLPSSPASGLPGPKRPRRLPRPVDFDDLVRAVTAAEGALRAQLVLAAWAGLRACELARLRTAYVTLTGRHPNIFVAADATKGSAERTVPLCPYAVSEVQAYRPPPGEWMFGPADGGPGHISPWRVSQQASQHLHDLGITATLHMLRHWFGTEYYLASGNDLRATQDVMGHLSPETTALYTRVRPARAEAAAARLPAPPLLRAVG
jgi:integrase